MKLTGDYDKISQHILIGDIAMWVCPTCKRSFSKANQNHFCENKINTIDEYISLQPEDVQPILIKVREAIKQAAPDAEERIAWGMPSFWFNDYIIHFCAHKKHLGIHPGNVQQLPFQDRLVGYKTSKGAIQFPYDKPIDYELIADITRWRVSCVEES